MNVTFHTLTGLSAASFQASRQNGNGGRRLFAPSDTPLLATGFISGMLMHGLLDYIPHSYPIRSTTDVALSLALFFFSLFMVGNGRWLLLCVCFLGSVFPDLVDL